MSGSGHGAAPVANRPTAAIDKAPAAYLGSTGITRQHQRKKKVHAPAKEAQVQRLIHLGQPLASATQDAQKSDARKASPCSATRGRAMPSRSVDTNALRTVFGVRRARQHIEERACGRVSLRRFVRDPGGSHLRLLTPPWADAATASPRAPHGADQPTA